MIHKIQIFILFLVVPLGAIYLYAQREGINLSDIFIKDSFAIAHVGEIPIKVEIVDTPEARTRGLSYRDDIGAADGMLFLFDTTDRHSMWMKDMKFPIDIIWIDEALTVVGIDVNVSPDTYPRKFAPPVPARFAIETEARFTETFGIYVGAKVRMPLYVEEKIAK